MCVCTCDRERERETWVGSVMPAPSTGAFSCPGMTSCWLNEDACHLSLIKINYKSPCFPQESLLNIPSGTCRGRLAASQSRSSMNWQPNLRGFLKYIFIYTFIYFLVYLPVLGSPHLNLFPWPLHRQFLLPASLHYPFILLSPSLYPYPPPSF